MVNREGTNRDREIVFEWSEAPPERAAGAARGGRWVEILQPLTQQPLQWAKFDAGDPKQANAIARNLRKRLVKVPEGDWEVIARGSNVYARYLGPGKLVDRLDELDKVEEIQ